MNMGERAPSCGHHACPGHNAKGQEFLGLPGDISCLQDPVGTSCVRAGREADLSARLGMDLAATRH